MIDRRHPSAADAPTVFRLHPRGGWQYESDGATPLNILVATVPGRVGVVPASCTIVLTITAGPSRRGQHADDQE